MIVAISSTGTSLESNVDSRFGRCPFFILYDTESDTFEHMPNEARGAMGGAGIQTGQAIAGKGAEAVITGNVGPNSFRVLSTANIKIYTGVTGKVSEAIAQFKAGQLTETSAPNVTSHFGMGGGMGGGGRG
ncbi:MAG: NifB/NifX family molybdenum-iron cluster-binding protein [Actinomycetota bacterium]|nr:NifB/NifX family molybdenum-iron cluster-binding protein [Actinomycetota bacterium]